MQQTKKTDEKNIADSEVAPLLLRCRTAIAPLLSLLLALRNCSCYLLRCRSAVAPLPLRCRYAIVQLSLFCCSNDSSVAPLPLLSLLMSLRWHCWYFSCCHSTITPAVALLLLWCCSGVAPLSFHYQSDVAPLLLRYRCFYCYCRSRYGSCCHSTAVAWIDIGRRLKRQNQGNSFHR